VAFLPFRPSAPVRARASAPPDPWASKRGFGRLWANLPPALAASLPPEGPKRWLALSPDGVSGHGPAGRWPCRLALAPLRLYRARGNQGGTKAVGGRLQPKSANPLKPPMYQLPNTPRTRGEARQAAGRPPPDGGGTRRLWAILTPCPVRAGRAKAGGPGPLFPLGSRASRSGKAARAREGLLRRWGTQTRSGFVAITFAASTIPIYRSRTTPRTMARNAHWPFATPR